MNYAQYVLNNCITQVVPVQLLTNLQNKETYNLTDWYSLYLRYNLKFKLTEDEEKLFLILILLPNKIVFDNNEYDNTLNITKEINYLMATNELIKKITSTKK